MVTSNQTCMIFFSSQENKRRHFEECWDPNSLGYHWLSLNGQTLKRSREERKARQLIKGPVWSVLAFSFNHRKLSSLCRCEQRNVHSDLILCWQRARCSNTHNPRHASYITQDSNWGIPAIFQSRPDYMKCHSNMKCILHSKT